MPSEKALLPAISNDTPDESTGWKLPSYSVAFTSTTGNPPITPASRALTQPFCTDGMNSLGTAPPTTLSSNSKPVPRGRGCISR